MFTPGNVFFGRIEQVRVACQIALDAAFAAYPERFPNGAPLVKLPPSEVHTNPLMAAAIPVARDACASACGDAAVPTNSGAH